MDGQRSLAPPSGDIFTAEDVLLLDARVTGCYIENGELRSPTQNSHVSSIWGSSPILVYTSSPASFGSPSLQSPSSSTSYHFRRAQFSTPSSPTPRSHPSYGPSSLQTFIPANTVRQNGHRSREDCSPAVRNLDQSPTIQGYYGGGQSGVQSGMQLGQSTQSSGPWSPTSLASPSHPGSPYGSSPNTYVSDYFSPAGSSSSGDNVPSTPASPMSSSSTSRLYAFTPVSDQYLQYVLSQIQEIHLHDSKKKTWRCMLCDKTMMTIMHAKDHVYTAHLGSNVPIRLECKCCDFTNQSESSMQKHCSSRHTGTRNATCECGQKGRKDYLRGKHREYCPIHKHEPRAPKRSKPDVPKLEIPDYYKNGGR
ncbi:hypothetical protein M422DRAFT_28898 [Sphaerobolus stellatus SS14]|nr:hypothetical protein M422DRAFT_28898 [Sphaerobolus stellatus SS14]